LTDAQIRARIAPDRGALKSVGWGARRCARA
jgi:hypothetical protein